MNSVTIRGLLLVILSSLRRVLSVIRILVLMIFSVRLRLRRLMAIWVKLRGKLSLKKHQNPLFGLMMHVALRLKFVFDVWAE